MSAVLLVGGRCDSYGAESGGPRRVMGGLHGPASARIDTDDVPGLPQAVVEGEWACKQPAQVRVRMVCRCDHTGDIMDLCSWHDETVLSGEMFAGKIRQVKTVKRVHGHYEEITRRQAGACIRCLFPGRFAADYKAMFSWQQELALLRDTGQWYSQRAIGVRQKLEDMVAEFDRGNADGTIHRCPMTLVAVS
jgi:hypothetical protein